MWRYSTYRARAERHRCQESQEVEGNHSIFILLTDREREIVRMLAEERSDKDIAHALRICIKTVDTHRVAIMRALGTRLLADLVRYAIRNQLIVP